MDFHPGCISVQYLTNCQSYLLSILNRISNGLPRIISRLTHFEAAELRGLWQEFKRPSQKTATAFS